MTKIHILIFLLTIHIIESIICIIKDLKNGNFKYAVRHGDGFRYATCADVLFYDLVIWEFLSLAFLIDFIGDTINKKFADHYNKKE